MKFLYLCSYRIRLLSVAANSPQQRGLKYRMRATRGGATRLPRAGRKRGRMWWGGGVLGEDVRGRMWMCGKVWKAGCRVVEFSVIRGVGLCNRILISYG